MVCSHGGHLTEMMQIEEAIKGHELFFITYISSRTRELNRAYLIERFTAKPWKIPLSTIRIFRILGKEKPKAMISTGAEIAIPCFLIAKILGIKTIYIETCARVRTPSGTGRLIYWISDYFFVQWRGLLRFFGNKARYEGGLL